MRIVRQDAEYYSIFQRMCLLFKLCRSKQIKITSNDKICSLKENNYVRSLKKLFYNLSEISSRKYTEDNKIWESRRKSINQLFTLIDRD